MINIVKIQDHSDSCCNPSVCAVKPSLTCMLDELNLAHHATVVELNATNELKGRLMGMGLTIGAKVEILHGSHGSFVIGVGEGRIAIGRDIAKMILVESDGVNWGTKHQRVNQAEGPQ